MLTWSVGISCLAKQFTTRMSLDSTQNELPLGATKSNSCGSVLVTTTLYPMDIPASILPPVRDSCYQTPAAKDTKSKTYAYKLSHRKDKRQDGLNGSAKFCSPERTERHKDIKFESKFGFDPALSLENASPTYRSAHGVAYVRV